METQRAPFTCLLSPQSITPAGIPRAHIWNQLQQQVLQHRQDFGVLIHIDEIEAILDQEYLLDGGVRVQGILRGEWFHPREGDWIDICITQCFPEAIIGTAEFGIRVILLAQDLESWTWDAGARAFVGPDARTLKRGDYLKVRLIHARFKGGEFSFAART